MRVKIEEVDGSEMERGTTGRIVEVEEGDAVETCFICDRSSVKAKSEEFEGEAARYCCDEHRDMHQPPDEDEEGPFPFGVRHKEACGRYMVAARDIEAGERVLLEEPLLVGPSHAAVPSCLDCMRKVDGAYLCPECNFPLCGEMCAYGGEHADRECKVFSGVEPKIEIKDFTKADPIYWNVTVVRGLLMKEEEPDKWAVLERMMDHNEDRRAEEDEDGTFAMYLENVVQFLRVRCNLADRFSESEILHVLGVCDVNSVRIHVSRDVPRCGFGPMLPGHALYPMTALLSHSCVSNSKTIVRPDYSCEVRATAFIPKGEEITKQYVNPLEPTNLRRKRLLTGWYFDCRCPRCCDPTENESFVGATACLRCKCGTILPSDPLNPNSRWQCDTCDFKTNGEAVDKLVEYFLIKINSVRIENIDEILDLLEKALKMFHSNHYIVTRLRINLNVAYLELASRMGLEPHKVPAELHLKRKEYLDEVHKVIEAVEPGLSRRRGLSLFEVATCHLQIGRLLNDQGRFSTQDFMHLCNTEIESLKECIRCLEHSPEGSYEASIHYKSTGALYEAEHTVKYLAQKEEEDEKVSEERRLRREEAEEHWNKLEKDVEAAAKGATVAVEESKNNSSVVIPDDIGGPGRSKVSLLMDEEKTVEELLMEDD